VGRRPNTVPPTKTVQLSSEWLASASELELMEFADQFLGIVLPLNAPRSQMITKIVNAAVSGRDGP
jgi:hypothetical protein